MALPKKNHVSWPEIFATRLRTSFIFKTNTAVKPLPSILECKKAPENWFSSQIWTSRHQSLNWKKFCLSLIGDLILSLVVGERRVKTHLSSVSQPTRPFSHFVASSS